MAKLTKRRKLINSKVEHGKQYPVGDAISILEELAKSNFKESYDVAVNLGISTRQSDQSVRGALTLPHGNGKTVRVAVFADGDKADEAREAGADLVGLDDLAETVNGGKIDFDVAIAARSAMRVVGRLGRILGPRGLMPNPRTGTVTDDISEAVQNAKSGQVQYRADRGGVVHGSVGLIGQSRDQVEENVKALIDELRRAKPAGAKGTYLRKVTLSTTMGPGIPVEVGSLETA